MNAPEKQFPIIHEFLDQKVGLHAYIVIDSLKNGNSCGGIRILEDVSLDEIKALARAMTLKYCFLKENIGGAKSGIILPKDCTPQQRTKILEAFGRQASSILKTRTYVLWTDMNSNANDIITIMNAAGSKFYGLSDSSYYTALTVVSAIKAACETKGMNLSTVSVIIEGFGAVGMNIASELKKWGVKIVGVSTVKGALYEKDGLDIDKLIELRKQYTDDFIFNYGIKPLPKKELLLEMETDILVPCARPWSINETNMEKIKAKIIIPGANVPLTKQAEDFFHQKGILYLPDFICNSGGVFGTKLFNDTNHNTTVHHFIINEFGQLVKELIQESINERALPSEIAKRTAEQNCQDNSRKNTSMQYRSFIKKNLDNFFHRDIYLQQFIPGLRGWNSIQNQRRVFFENIKNMKKQM